jgi:quercetin dioxygenase-like cupin family protein
MTPEEFKSELGKVGFTEFVLVEWPADGMAALHSHPFEARALILSGEITLKVDGSEHCFRPGEVFQLARGQPHEERYGPSAVRYLVGRR